MNNPSVSRAPLFLERGFGSENKTTILSINPRLLPVNGMIIMSSLRDRIYQILPKAKG